MPDKIKAAHAAFHYTLDKVKTVDDLAGTPASLRNSTLPVILRQSPVFAADLGLDIESPVFVLPTRERSA